MDGSSYESGPDPAQEEESGTGSGEEDGTVHDWRTSPTNGQWSEDGPMMSPALNPIQNPA